MKNDNRLLEKQCFICLLIPLFNLVNYFIFAYYTQLVTDENQYQRRTPITMKNGTRNGMKFHNKFLASRVHAEVARNVSRGELAMRNNVRRNEVLEGSVRR